MPDYSKGKVYCIRSPHTTKIYVGSTTLSLTARFGEHKRLYKHYTTGRGAGKRGGCTSESIISEGDAYIELLELWPCNSKEELNAREGYRQRLIGPDNLINRSIAGRTDSERVLERKQMELERARMYDARRRAKKRGEVLPPLPERMPIIPT
jgi:hypothetical protein